MYDSLTKTIAFADVGYFSFARIDGFELYSFTYPQRYTPHTPSLFRVFLAIFLNSHRHSIAHTQTDTQIHTVL